LNISNYQSSLSGLKATAMRFCTHEVTRAHQQSNNT